MQIKLTAPVIPDVLRSGYYNDVFWVIQQNAGTYQIGVAVTESHPYYRSYPTLDYPTRFRLNGERYYANNVAMPFVGSTITPGVRWLIHWTRIELHTSALLAALLDKMELHVHVMCGVVAEAATGQVSYDNQELIST